MRRLIEDIRAQDVAVEILVNNAGFSTVGDVHENPDRQLGMIRVNVEALVDLTDAFLPAMTERGRGAVIQVASTSSFQPVPVQATYAATQGLREELQRGGVDRAEGNGRDDDRALSRARSPPSSSMPPVSRRATTTWTVVHLVDARRTSPRPASRAPTRASAPSCTASATASWRPPRTTARSRSCSGRCRRCTAARSASSRARPSGFAGFAVPWGTKLSNRSV